MTRSMTKPFLLCCLVSLALVPGHRARADGEFFQLDLGEDASDAVFAAARGPWNIGVTASSYVGGWSTGAAVTYAIPLAELGTLKVGPSIGQAFGDSGNDDPALGAKVIFDRWAPTRYGHVYVAAEYDTIDNNWFALFQTGEGSSGLGVELSAGGSDKYDERTLALTKRLGSGPVSLRAGYKFKAESLFLGVSVNTF